MGKSFTEHARAYCEIRLKEKRIRASLKRCERVQYYDDLVEVGPFDEFGQPSDVVPRVKVEDTNEGGGFCSRTMVEGEWDGGSFGPPDPEPLSEEYWCQSCRDNLPAVHELREVRKRIGGLASQMFRAYRKEYER